MPVDNQPEAAFELLAQGIGRRDLLKATAAVGAGAVAPAWLLSPGGLIRKDHFVRSRPRNGG